MDDAVREEIRLRLEGPGGAGGTGGGLGPADPGAARTAVPTAGGRGLHTPDRVLRFYEARGFRPAWSSGGEPVPALEALLGALGAAHLEGLDPDHHHLELIESLDAQLRPLRETEGPSPAVPLLADLDLLSTDAYLAYAAHLVGGRVDPVSLDPDWSGQPGETDLVSRLERALSEDRIEESLRDLFYEAHPGYLRLRSALAHYRSLAAAGGWEPVPVGDTLRPGVRSRAVGVLRTRLAAGGDLSAVGDPPRPAVLPHDSLTAPPDSFGPALEAAVRRFQRRHGLQEDGVVGPATLAALNVPARDRIRQIELNLERWRWMPRELGSRYILVNIAAFRVDVVEGIETILTMRAIVGQAYRKTPVFSDTVRYLVLNPSWTVPHSIAVNDKLPLIRRDPGYLERYGYRVYRGWGADAVRVDPDTVDWSRITARNFPYRLYQEPGPHNALGRVKFMFPNRFNVYLHDTPERALFARTTRTFSSGCIRVENPLELAELLLRDDPSWTRERMNRVLDGGNETTVRLPGPVPIHIQYWTAWAEPDGTVHFRPDVYDRDAALDRALREADGAA